MISFKFKDSSKVFFTSDQHWGHKNICEYANRPWSPDSEGLGLMNQALIDNWNRVVPVDGIVFHLGDIFLCSTDEAISISNQLNGNIHLIYGNHDKPAKTQACSTLFDSRQDYLKIRVADKDCEYDGYQTIVLFHYPIASWEQKSYGSFHLYGHCHGTFDCDQVHKADMGTIGDYLPRCMDVGVDCSINPAYDDPNGGYLASDYSEGLAHQEWTRTSYAPIPYALIKERLIKRSLIPVISGNRSSLKRNTNMIEDWKKKLLNEGVIKEKRISPILPSSLSEH